MITQQEISGLLNQQVLGNGGQKIGQAKHVFYDDATGRPEWVTVKTGMLSGGETFIPVREAVASEGHLKVPYSKDKIKSAPTVDIDAKGHLSAQEESRLYRFYGIDGGVAGQRPTGQQRMGNEQRAAADQRAAGQVSGQAAGQRAAEPQAAAPQAAAPQAAAPQAGMDAAASGDAGLAEDAMMLSEEKMHVRVERRESGQARLHKYIETEEREQTVPLRHEEARLIREPITDANRGDAVAGAELSEADHVVTLHAERPVVETTVEPTERVRLAVEERTEQQTVRGTVRKEQIRIEDAPEDDQRR